jgi:hypothetical protein
LVGSELLPPPTPKRDHDRDDGHAAALDPRSEHGSGTESSADPLGEHRQQLVAAAALARRSSTFRTR